MMLRGRPHKVLPSPWQFPRAEQVVSRITFFLDKIMRWYHTLRTMADTPQTATSMKQRLIHEIEHLSAIRKEMGELAAAYNRFIDLQADFERRRERAQRIAALLGQEGMWFKNRKSDEVYRDYLEAVGAPPFIAELRCELPVWEAMKEYLSHVPEARINEMLDFFQLFGHKGVNRQAIESALRRHPGVFATRKRKKEKFILLKAEARD